MPIEGEKGTMIVHASVSWPVSLRFDHNSASRFSNKERLKALKKSLDSCPAQA